MENTAQDKEKDFIQKVIAMRKAQRQFFKSRDNYNLKLAKKKEDEVDYWIRDNYPELLKEPTTKTLF